MVSRRLMITGCAALGFAIACSGAPPSAPSTEPTTTPLPKSSARADATASVNADRASNPRPPITPTVSRKKPPRDPHLPGKTRASSGSTAVHTKDRKLFIAGQDRGARHLHGGAPAHIGYVRFIITNDSDENRRVTATRVAYLRDHGCEAPPTTVVSRPNLGYFYEDGEYPKDATTTLDIPPHTSETVMVTFEAVDAYYVWCDRFPIEVTTTFRPPQL